MLSILRAIAVSAGLFAAAATSAEIQSLDGIWRIATDLHNAGREQRWYSGEPVNEARAARVPDILETTFPGYDGLVWYWKTFETREAGSGERIFVRFHAADYLVEVWLNGIPVGSHEGGETPFSLDVTRAIRAGTNRIVVRLLNPGKDPIDGITVNETPRSIKFSPTHPGWFWNCGGIWQSVDLVRAPEVRVTDVFADARWGEKRVTVRIALRNDSAQEVAGRLALELAPAAGGAEIARRIHEVHLPGGDSTHEIALAVPGARAWSPDDPYLYRVTARLESPKGTDAQSVRCGFRDFEFRDGYFRLNGKRIYWKSAHTTGHFPLGQHAAHDRTLLRKELLYAKTMGLNGIRTIAKMLYPEQLDLCDELGLMVYEESYASWGSAGIWGVPQVSRTVGVWTEAQTANMRRRFDLSLREMVQRDRNHPSIVMWGVLNETQDSPLFRHGVDTLPLVRELDASRVVMLNSGRWDGQWSIGSLANPRSSTWAHAFGPEAPGAPAVDVSRLADDRAGAGDVHRYIPRPWTAAVLRWFRHYGPGERNVFLSEFGNGSQMNPVRLTRQFEEAGAAPHWTDAALYRKVYDRFLEDWTRWGLDRVFASPADLFRAGEALHARHRAMAVSAVRSNPRIIGLNITGLSDQCNEGEGLLTLFREPKKDVIEALGEALAPLRWSVFTEPANVYRGARVRVEAVLVNEDVLRPGEYPVRLRVTGPDGWSAERTAVVRITPGSPMAMAVFDEDILFAGAPGYYDVVVRFDRGAAAEGRRSVWMAGRPSNSSSAAVAVLDDSGLLAPWLKEHGMGVSNDHAARVIVTGRAKPEVWRVLLPRVKAGATAVILDPRSTAGKDGALPAIPARVVQSGPAFWGRDDVVMPHPIFKGLPVRTLMDLDFYGEIVPHESLEGFSAKAEVIVACFAAGIPFERVTEGYWSGANILVLPAGEGKFIVSTLRLLEHLGKHPAADRILLNLLSYARAD